MKSIDGDADGRRRHDGRRPRERLRSLGVSSLATSELVALLLRTGGGERANASSDVGGLGAREPRGRTDVVQLAEALLLRFGGLTGLLAQPLDVLVEVPGVGMAKAAGLVAVRELARRAALEDLSEAPVLAGSNAVTRFLQHHMAGYEREVFGLLLLDSRARLIAVADLFYGSIDRAAVYPREVVRACLDRNAASVVVYHNHPSGVAEPSMTDVDLTRRLATLLQAIDVRLLDHVVVGGASVVSFAERQILP